ncbi:hypothetical protein ACWEWU_11755 [Staphylococcus xylosus]
MIIFNDRVIMALPLLKDGKIINNDYGKPEYEYVETLAHIRFSIKTMFDEKGQGFTTRVQIYLPFNTDTFRLDSNYSKLKYVLPNNQNELSSIFKIEYGQGITGKTEFIKVYL